MKHKFLNKLLTLALLTLGGVINPVWADSTMTFTPSSKDSGTLSGAPSGVSATFANTYNSANQITSTNSMTLTLSGWDSSVTITGITLHMKTNKSSGAGSVSAKIGSTTIGSMTISTIGSTYTNKTISITPTNATANLVIKIDCTTNSVYCDKFTITYSATPKSTAPTIDGGGSSSNFTISKDVVITAADGATIYYTTDGTNPDEDSDEYSSAIHITSTTTIKAIALEDGKALSSVSSKTFTKVLADNSITVTDGNTHNIALTGVGAVDEYSISASATSGGTVTYAVKSATNLIEGTDFDFEDGDFAFYNTYKGIIVVTASVAADDDYASASQDITINCSGDKRDPVIAYDGDDTEISSSGSLVIDTDLIETDGYITVESSNTSVATVSDYTISAVADGTTTITITTEEGTYYNAGSGSFELEVVTPSACDIALTGAPVSKTFDVYNNAHPQVINYTTSSTGTVSIAANDYATFAIDQVNKKITVTPKSATPSTQTITINQAASGRYLAGSTTFSLTVSNSATSETYEKVTNDATLAVDDELAIVNEAYRKAAGSISSNLLTPVGISISSSSFGTTSGVVTYILGGSSGSWTLKQKDSNYYLSCNSSSDITNVTSSPCTWSISISEGNASVKSSVKASSKDQYLQYNYNSGNDRFKTYTSTQTAIQLYKRAKYPNTITVTNGTAQTLTLASATSLTLSSTSYCGAVSYTYKSASGLTKDTHFTFDAATGELEVDEDAPSGTITITASTVESTTHKAASVDIVITVVGKSKSEVEFALSDQTKQSGATYTLENGVDFETDGTVTLYSTNTNVATVAGLTVTAVGVGSTTITVSCAEGTLYKEGEDDFTFTVTAPAGATTVSDVVLFNETFANCSGTGGNKSGSFENGSQSAMVAADADETYSSLSYTYAAEGCAKVGTGSYASALTTSTISLTGDATLTFSGAGWKGDETNTLSVTATGATLSGDNSITLTNATWKDYSVSISGATGSVTLTFAGKRGFLDDIKITQSPTATVTLNKYGFATYCSEKPIDFSSTEDYTAWRVSSIAADGTITFTKITEKIKGGQGVLLYNKDADGVNTSNVTINFANGTTEFTSSENKLVGTTAPVYIDEVAKIYGLSDNKFVKNNATGNIGANKAYILATSIPASVKAFNFVFEDEDDPDGIRIIENVSIEEAAQIFDLSGRRLNKVQKGINIVNGKKILK